MHQKEVTFIDNDDPTPAEDHYGKQPLNENRNPTTKEGLGQVDGYERGEEEDKKVKDTVQEVTMQIQTQSNYQTHGAMKFTQ